MSIVDQLAQAFTAELDQYARYKGEKTPSLFGDEGNASWDESKHPRVEKGSTAAHGGQFTSQHGTSENTKPKPDDEEKLEHDLEAMAKEAVESGGSIWAHAKSKGLGLIEMSAEQRKQYADYALNYRRSITKEPSISPARAAAQAKYIELNKPTETLEDSDKTHWYGMNNRPLQGGAQPKGFNETKPHPDFRHGAIGYASPLSKEDEYNYELTPLRKDSDIPGVASEAIKLMGGYEKQYAKNDKLLIDKLNQSESRKVIGHVDQKKLIAEIKRQVEQSPPPGSTEASRAPDPVAKSPAETIYIPLRERKAIAEKLAKSGMNHDELVEHLTSMGVAKPDARKLADDAIDVNGGTMPGNVENPYDAKLEAMKKRRDPDGIEMPSKTVPNSDAKPGDQLGLFGDAVKAPKPLFRPQLLENATKAKQGGLFDTKGNPNQMDLFGGGGIPEDMTYKPEVKAEQKKSDEVATGLKSSHETIPRISNDDFVNGGWDKSHSGLASESVQSRIAHGMEGIEGREYGIREHSPGKFQMVSRPMAKPPTSGVNSPANADVEAARERWKQANAEVQTTLEREPKTQAKPSTSQGRIKTDLDFGEKIEVRKHTARSTGPRAKKELTEAEKAREAMPAWRKRYDVAEDANKPGEHFIVDRITKQPHGDSDPVRSGSFAQELAKRLGKQGKKPSGFVNFKNKDDAEKQIAQIEVNRNHGVLNRNGDYQIYRKVSDSKHPMVKGGFKSDAEAREYMKNNPAEIIQHEFPRYETHQYLDKVERTGGKDHRNGKDAKPEDFQKVFNSRAGVFGNWQSNKDGQVSLNHAYDGLHDLADALNLPPKAISLNGQLAIGFGADGTGGKDSARAHYSPDKGLINLTKMKGAGSLAHEWFHALDHHLAKMAGAKLDYSTTGLLGTDWKDVRPELADAIKGVHHAIASKQVTKEIQADSDEEGPHMKTIREREGKELSDAKEKNTRIPVARTVDGQLWNLRHSMHTMANYKKKTITPEMLKEFDELSEKLSKGDTGNRSYKGVSKGPYSGYPTFDNLDKLNQVYKQATGRSFHTQDNSDGRSLYHALARHVAQKNRTQQASEGKTETKIETTDYSHDARRLDETFGGDYYSKKEEMGARAFEAYIQDKLAGKGIKSQYLGAKAKNADYPGSLRPFPHAEEREAINAAFDHLFTTLKHQNRTDDKGEHVQLYSAMFTPILLERYANSDWADQVRDDLGRWTEQSIPKVEPKLLNDHSGKNVHEQLRKWGLATIRDESFKNNDKNWSIKVDKGGIKKIAAQSIDSAMSLLVLPEVIKHSIFESTEKNTKSNANPDAVFHYFLCPVVMHGDTWAIRMTVEESKQTGKKAYTLHAIEIKKGSPQIPGGRRSVIEPGVRQAPEINIDKAWEEIKSGNDYYSQNPDNFTIEHYAGKDQLRWDFGDEHEPVGGPAISSRRRKPPKSQAEADEMAKNGHMVVTGTSRDVLKCERCGRTHLHKTYVVETIGDDGKPMRDKHYYGSDCVSRMTGKPIESIQRAAAAAQHIRQVESSRQPVKYSQESDDLFYDANRERQTRDLYNALSDAFLVDRYDNTNWSEQLHPRGHKGNENGGRFTSKGDSGGTATESHPPGSPSGNRPNQSSGSAVDAQSNGTRANGFSSKVRQIASVPDIQFHHSLHIRNQPPANQIALNDYKKSFNHLWRTASGKAGVEWTDATAEEKIWDNVDKNKLTELLNNINAKDKALRADGGSGLSDSINYNQVIPRHFAERLHGGSRFFDPEKLQRKWHEAAPPPKPESIGHLPGQTNPGQIQSSDLSKAFTSELSKKRPSKSKPNGFQPELPVQENPGQIQPPKVNPVEDELSEKTRKMVNKAISELISSDPQTIEDFRPILISAWKQKLDEAAQHNHAFREIVGTRTPQFMSALVRQARNNTLDPSSKKNFDIMVHSAESGRFGHLLQGRGEDGLLDLLSEGIKQEPNIMDEDVAELAVGMAGPGFFGDRDPGEAPEELQPAGSSEDWNDQFSWRSARALVERYSHESPTPAQREAGNYRKKHIRIQGMGISIENKKGTRRKPDWPKLHCDYGYIKRTMGADGDHVDVFVGPSPGSEIVYIIDQVDKNGRFDEHKAMVGFTSKQQAVEAYKKCYTPSWKVGRVTAMTVGQFKLWLDKGNQKESISKQVSRYQMSLGQHEAEKYFDKPVDKVTL